MKKFITLSDVGDLYMGEIFEWYDGPKLFLLNKKDDSKPLFLSYWIGDEDNRESWIIIPISEDRILKYKNNVIDFLDFLNVLNEENVYRLDLIFKTEQEIIKKMSKFDISLILWPKKGLFYKSK